MTDENLQVVSQPVMEAVLKAHEDKDYTLLKETFCKESEVHLPPEDLFNDAVEKAVQPLGKSVSMTYMGSVAKPDARLALWKVKFDNSREELLWHIYLNEKMNLKAIWFG